MREVKHQHGHLLDAKGQSLAFNEHTDKTVFELPDKNRILFGKELFTVPEIYFSDYPEENFKGIQHLISQCL